METKNCSYQLEEYGASATRLEKDYKIALPSYTDGRLCCEGSYCASLNKSYPLCSELKPEAAICAADLCEVAFQCNPGATETKNCECGSQTRSCGGGCQWGAWSGSCWSKSGGRTETKPCQELQDNLRGTATRVCEDSCDGQGSCPAWTTSGCSMCQAPAGEPTSQACPSGYTGTQTRTWNYNTCSWSAWQKSCYKYKWEEKTCYQGSFSSMWAGNDGPVSLQENNCTFTCNASNEGKTCSVVYKTCICPAQEGCSREPLTCEERICPRQCVAVKA